MKKKLLLFSAVLCALAANAQTGAGTILTLNSTAIAGGSTSSADQSYIATLPGGENLIASHLKDAGTDYISIRKIHNDGTLTTIKNLVSTGDPLLGLTCSISGNFTCFSGQGENFNLVKFGSSGTILWQKSITITGETISEYYGTSHKLMETPSGDYYLLISNFSFTGLIKIDANGNFLWANKMAGPRDTGKCPGFSTEITQDEGTVTSLKDDSYETLINIDANGNLRWSRSFGDASYRWTRSIKADNLGNFFIMGTYGSGGATYVQKVDSNGNLIFGKNLSGSFSYFDAYVTSGNDFYIITQNPSFHLAKIGASGNVLWDRAIGATTPELSATYGTYFTSTRNLADLNFICYLNDSLNSEIVFHTADMAGPCNTYSNGTVNTTDDVQIFDASVDTTCHINPLTVTVSNTGLATTTTEYYTSRDFCAYIASVAEHDAPAELNVYPNPATDHITIDLKNIRINPGTMLVIYDMTGRKVRQSTLDNINSMNVSTSGLTPGLYTVMISDANNVVAKQRIVIQK